MHYFPRRSNSITALNMSSLRFYKTKSPKNRKAGYVHTVELTLPSWMVKSFCSQNWIRSMKEKHSQKIKLSLKLSDKTKGDDESKGDDEQFIFSATGKHRQTMVNLASDIVERYNKMIDVIKKIVKE